MYDIYVIRGNAAVFKCHVPSFVSDHLQVVSWHDSDGGEFLSDENYGTLVEPTLFEVLRILSL